MSSTDQATVDRDSNLRRPCHCQELPGGDLDVSPLNLYICKGRGGGEEGKGADGAKGALLCDRAFLEEQP